MGRFDEAMTEFKKALSLDPFAPRINLDLGKELTRRGQYDLALEQIKKTLELQPDFGTAHYELGRALLRQEKYEEALISFERAEDLAPTTIRYAHRYVPLDCPSSRQACRSLHRTTPPLGA